MNNTKFFITLILYVFAFYQFFGQETDQRISIIKVLEKIENNHQINFNYESELLSNIEVFSISDKLSLSLKIKNLEKQTGLVFKKVSNAVYSISKAIYLCGYIKDAEFQLPLIGATINSKSAYAITDDNGFFELKLRSLNDVLIIRHLGFNTIERQLKNFNLKKCQEVFMFAKQEDIVPIHIQSYLVKGIDKRKDWTTSIDNKRFSLLPGLIESDILQTVQALPGILSVDESVSNINIRGGSHDQNLILWDDIKMYQTGHFFGLISSFNPLMTQTADIINNGTDVSLTDGVSGTIHMQTEKKVDSEFKGITGINFLNAEVFFNIPIKNTSLQIASRKSINDLLNTPTYEAYFDRVIQNTEAKNNTSEVYNSNQKFKFHDVSIRWLYNPTNKDVIRLNFIVLNNNLGFNETANFNNETRTRRSNITQNSIAFGANYKRLWNDNWQSIINIYETDYKLHSTNADVLNNQRQLQENIVSETSLKISNLFEKNMWRFNFGYQFRETEVTNLNDIDLPRFVRRDEEVLREHGAFGQIWYTDTQNDFSVRGGVRANYLAKFNKFLVEPRLSIRKSIGDNLEIEAQGEFKHQSTSQIVNFQNDFLGVEKRRWLMADNNSIPIIKSKQSSIGVLYKNQGWLFDAKVFYKLVNGITTQSQSFTTKYEFSREVGQYDAYGFEFLFRKKIMNLNSWFSYSFIDNTYSFDTLVEKEFPSNFDVTHSFSLGSTFDNNFWKISVGMNYRTGKPTSIPLKGTEIIDNNLNFDIANNERLSDYLRIDASAIFKFKISPTLNSEIGASIWNLSNRKNTINHYYRLKENNINKFSRYSLGLTTNAVIRFYF